MEQLLLEDFIDDVEQDDLTVSHDDDEVLKEIKDDDEWEYALIIEIQDDSKAMAVCYAIERYLEKVIEVSEYAVDIFSSRTEACVYNMYNTSVTTILIGFSLNKKFSTPYRVIIFLRYILAQANKLSLISGRVQYCMLVYKPEAEEHIRRHLISRTVYGMLSFIKIVNGEHEVDAKKYDNEFRDCHRQLFETCGWMTNRYVRTIQYIDEGISYYDLMTQKLSKYTMRGKKKLKMSRTSQKFLENHLIDMTQVYKTQKWVSAEFYLPMATQIFDVGESGFVYSPQHVNDSDVEDVRNALSKISDVRLHHVQVSYEKDEMTWMGYGKVRIVAFLCAYPKMDGEQSAENVFLMITGNRRCIDVLVTYLECCFGETLPEELTKDLFSIVIQK